MAIETTLSIIKPDAVERNLVGKIIARFEEAGLRPVAIRRQHLSKSDAEGFYAVHSERPFFGELVEFMTRSPVVIMALQGDNAVLANREIMGATNPADAADGTIRKLYANSIGENSVHGSDSVDNAAIEIDYFFRSIEVNG
ncbi:MAG: nucleoside-diphosphate kinase [Kiritimatiellia bacterium]|jgi:nucleoside-diphosphate kinase